MAASMFKWMERSAMVLGMGALCLCTGCGGNAGFAAVDGFYNGISGIVANLIVTTFFTAAQ